MKPGNDRRLASRVWLSMVCRSSILTDRPSFFVFFWALWTSSVDGSPYVCRDRIHALHHQSWLEGNGTVSSWVGDLFLVKSDWRALAGARVMTDFCSIKLPWWTCGSKMSSNLIGDASPVYLVQGQPGHHVVGELIIAGQAQLPPSSPRVAVFSPSNWIGNAGSAYRVL